MNKQYIKLMEYFTEEIYKKSSVDIKQLYKLQNSNMNELFDIIAKIMLDYNIKDNIMDLTAGQIDLLANKISSSIEEAFSYQNSLENKVINSVLGAAIIDKFYSNVYINSLGVSKMNIKNLSDKEIHKIVITKVKGDSWDDRVWNNKHETANVLQQEMEEFLKGKTSVNSIKKKIKDKFGSNAYNTERLVQYEVARCQNAANELFNKKYGVDQVFYSATLDIKTCSCCSKYDSITYDVDDLQRPELPQHPFCRCCYISVPYEGWSPKKRKDNITKEIIDYKSYEKWYSENIRSTGAIGKIHKNDFKRKEDHAKVYYESIRKRKDDIQKISQNSGLSINAVKEIKDHVFFNKYDLINGYMRFDPDYNMAISWQRLIEGKNIRDMDIILLKHERLEKYLMDKYNYEYSDAHRIVERKYNYSKYVKED